MDKQDEIEAYYAKEHPFKEAIAQLRNLALQTEAMETYKWNFPVYTIDNKNVFGICRFKSHFGIWFFNGAFMDDPNNVLENAQEGKTKGMRHWKLFSIDAINSNDVLSYLRDAIQRQKEGAIIVAEKTTKALHIPEYLQKALSNNSVLKTAFESFSPYKQKEFCEYIEEAKQEKTKLRRLDKIMPMIEKGIGLNDTYRK